MQQTPPRQAASTTSVLTIFGISPHKSSLKRQITEDHPQISLSSPVRSTSKGVQSPSLGNAWSETTRHPSIASARSCSPVSDDSTAPVTLQDYQTPSTSICDEDTIEYTPRTLRRLRGGLKNSPQPKVAQSKARMSTPNDSDDELAVPVPATSKKHIRENIANDTTVRRNQFLIEKKDYWLPLLPANNHVQRLVEKHERRTPAERASMPAVCPYDEFTSQPRGIKAEMKPYQLSGLSFLVYLQRNGLAGILGDEMGLGKTLQTISLIQYLKESTLGSGTGNLQRPCLVVCPLSVLSSWMAETKRWAPNLRVLRFHGPIKERVRMKKIVVGEIDVFGRPVAKGGAKKSTHVNGDVRDETVGVDLVVTTYESFRAEQAWFKRAFVWRYVILDEGHMVGMRAAVMSELTDSRSRTPQVSCPSRFKVFAQSIV